MKNYKIKVQTSSASAYEIVSAEDELQAIDMVVKHYQEDLKEEIIDIEVI